MAGKQFADEARLLETPRHGRPALPAGGGPAGLGDEDRLAGKAALHVFARPIDMVDGGIDTDRIVLPVGQDMDADDIHMRPQRLGMPFPERPDVGIADRHGRCAPGAGQQFPEGGGLQLAAQQHFVADDQQVDDIPMRVREGERLFELPPVGHRVAADPGAEQDAQAEFPGDSGHGIEAVVEAVGADAGGDGRQQAQVGLDGLGGKAQFRIEGRVTGAPERCIGHARQRGIFDLGQRHGARTEESDARHQYDQNGQRPPDHPPAGVASR